MEEANRLIYTKGYNQTSFADIAAAVGITKGNLHYHFPSKDELLTSVIDFRKTSISDMLDDWEQSIADPKDKLRRFTKMLLNENENLARYGCPMGSLNMELGKQQLPLREKSREMFDLFLSWLKNVFKQLGKDQTYALHLLAMAQGAALMSYAYADKKLLAKELAYIHEWIERL